MKREEFQDWIKQNHFGSTNQFLSFSVGVDELYSVLNDLKKREDLELAFFEGIFVLGTDKEIYLSYLLSGQKLEQSVLVRCQVNRSNGNEAETIPTIKDLWVAAEPYEAELAKNYALVFTPHGRLK